MALPQDALDAIYEAALEVQAGTATLRGASQAVSTTHELNRSTVSGLIHNVRQMLTGTTYKRVAAAPDVDYLLGRIQAEQPPDGLELALQSVEGHIAYYEHYRGVTFETLRSHVIDRGGPNRPHLPARAAQTSTIADIARELNLRAHAYKIGSVQNIRAQLRGMKRLASRSIFSSATTKEDYAFHLGGRCELQFNIGVEQPADIRFGVAFSFEKSQALPTPEPLYESVRRFNDFFREHPGAYSDLSMWHHDAGGPGDLHSPASIPGELLDGRAFVFLGLKVPLEEIDFDQILETFDRLLPLYIEVESRPSSPPPSIAAAFEITPGCPPLPEKTSATSAPGVVDVSLRHNLLQQSLMARLQEDHGYENVGREQGPGRARVDVIVKTTDGWWFYEIKTAITARGCIREAIGQLLEYAYWPGGATPSRLVVAGEPELDAVARDYLDILVQTFKIPLSYEQVSVLASLWKDKP